MENGCTNKNRIVSDQSRHNIGRSCSLVICDTDGSPKWLVMNKYDDKHFFFNISFYCTTSLITDYKYTYVTINGL